MTATVPARIAFRSERVRWQRRGAARRSDIKAKPFRVIARVAKQSCTAGRPAPLVRRQTYSEVNGVRDERSDRALRIAGLGPATAQLCTAHKFDRGRIIVLAGDNDLATGEYEVCDMARDQPCFDVRAGVAGDGVRVVPMSRASRPRSSSASTHS